MLTKLFCFFLLATTAVASDNLIYNSDLTTGSDGWILTVAESGARVAHPDVNGEYCLMLKADGKGDKVGYWAQINLPIVEKKEYTFRYKVKGSIGESYRVYIECSSPSQAVGTDWKTIKNDGWETNKVTFSFTSVKDAPDLILQVKPSGQIYFDEISLVENPEKQNETVLNGSFEQGTVGWESDEDNLIAGGGYAGKSCLKLVSDQKDVDSFAVQKKIPLKTGEKYRLTYWVKAGQGSAAGTGYQYFRVFASWDGILQQDGLNWQDALQSWQRRTLEFTAPIKSNPGLNITCQVQGPGTIYFDNLKLERIVDVKKNTSVEIILSQPYYRDLIFSTYPVDSIEGEVLIKSDDVRRVMVAFGQKNKTPIWSKNFPVSSPAIKFCIPAKKLTDGEYVLNAKGVSEKAVVLGEDSRTIKKLAPDSNEVVIREDNVTIVNGKPFFPIGLWDVAINERDLHELSKAGVNIFRSEEFNKDILDMAERQHMKMIGGITEYLPENPDDPQRKILEKRSRDRINKFRDHPALLVYYLSDEPCWGGRPLGKLLASYHYHRELDPYRPIWINEAPRGEVAQVAEYGRACDVFGVDIYPVPEVCWHSGLTDQTIACVGKYADRMRDSVNDRKPIWMTLQGFAWGDHANLLNNGPKKAVYPTFKQSRFMAYDAVIHGATGIMYWGTHYIAEPLFWDVLLKTTSELRDMSSVFVSETVKNSSIKCDQAAIKFMHKRCEGKDYILAANDSKAVLDVTFETPFKEQMVKVFFEDRNVKIQGGRFTDHFEPYDVHVYSNSKALPSPLVSPPKKVPDGKVLFLEATRQAKKHLEKLKQLPLYKGKANWIWYPGKHYKTGQRTFFRRTFDVKKPIKKVTLLAGVDSETGVLYVNGQKINETFPWGPMKTIDISSLIKQGKNVIAWDCFSGDWPPSGLFCELVVETTCGEKKIISSDGSWRVSEKADESWVKSDFDDKDWVTAEILGPTGTSPWGAVRMIGNVAGDSAGK